MESYLCEVECAASSSSMILQKDVLREKRSSAGTVASVIRYADDCRTTTYRVAV